MIEYGNSKELSVEEFKKFLGSSSIKRPADDIERLKSM